MSNENTAPESAPRRWVDRIWFERHPDREFRLRKATAEEMVAWGKSLRAGHTLWTLVRLSDGRPLHFTTDNPDGIADVDATLRTFFEELREIEDRDDDLPFSIASF